MRKTILSYMLITTSTHAFSTNIYLNGTDVSNAREQILKNVDIYIDKEGSVHITGKYDVKKENAYLPLTQKQAPKHQAPAIEAKNNLPTINENEELPTSPADPLKKEPPVAVSSPSEPKLSAPTPEANTPAP